LQATCAWADGVLARAQISVSIFSATGDGFLNGTTILTLIRVRSGRLWAVGGSYGLNARPQGEVNFTNVSIAPRLFQTADTQGSYLGTYRVRCGHRTAERCVYGADLRACACLSS
jgi:hypothetical protein